MVDHFYRLENNVEALGLVKVMQGAHHLDCVQRTEKGKGEEDEKKEDGKEGETWGEWEDGSFSS